MKPLQITEQDIRDYCFLRMPKDSPLYEVLHDEFVLDPANSRVGQFCKETERIVRQLMVSDQQWDAFLLASNEAAETGEVSDEFRNQSDVKSGETQE